MRDEREGGGTGEDSLAAFRSNIEVTFLRELPEGHLRGIQHTKTSAVVGLIGVAVMDVLVVVYGGVSGRERRKGGPIDCSEE